MDRDLRQAAEYLELDNPRSYPNFQYVTSYIKQRIGMNFKTTKNMNIGLWLEQSQEPSRFINMLEQYLLEYSTDVVYRDNAFEQLRERCNLSNLTSAIELSAEKQQRGIVFLRTLDDTPLITDGFQKIESISDYLTDVNRAESYARNDKAFIEVYVPDSARTNKTIVVRVYKGWIWGDAYLALKIYQYNFYKQEGLITESEETKLFEEILEELEKKDTNGFLEKTNEIFQLNALVEKTKAQLAKIFTYRDENMKENLEEQIRSMKEEIENYRRVITNEIAKLYEKQEMLTFFQEKDNKEQEARDIVEYIYKHPYIETAIKEGDHYLNLYFKAPLLYFSEEAGERLLEKEQEGTTRHKVLKTIIDAEYELMTNCHIIFDTKNFEVSISQDSLFKEHTIPHPHIDRYNCLGNHGTAIEEAAVNANYYGAIEQISQAVLNLNFYDGIVLNELLHSFTNYDRFKEAKCWRKAGTEEYYTIEEI